MRERCPNERKSSRANQRAERKSSGRFLVMAVSQFYGRFDRQSDNVRPGPGLLSQDKSSGAVRQPGQKAVGCEM
jgi:hypothetical protein